MADETKGIRTRNPHTGQWEKASPEMAAEHEAQRDGKPAPGDAGPEDAASVVGPVVTSTENVYSTEAAGTAGRATGGRRGGAANS